MVDKERRDSQRCARHRKREDETDLVYSLRLSHDPSIERCAVCSFKRKQRLLLLCIALFVAAWQSVSWFTDFLK